MAKYASWYVQSSGQPVNGFELHTSKAAAIKRARWLRGSLPKYCGGRAVAEVVSDTESRRIYSWYEYAEGGYLEAV